MRLAGAAVAAVAAAAAVMVAGPGRARADDGFIGRPKVPLEIDDCPPRPTATPEQLFADASERYSRGEVLHLQGDYQGAIDELVQFYCLAHGLPGADDVLKDIAQSYERMVKYEKAVAYLERYVIALAHRTPADANEAKHIEAERQLISARIEVLERLSSNITVATEPDGASVVIESDAGPQASGRDGQELSITAGTYTLVVSKPGFVPIRREIVVGIGQPYSFSFLLEPEHGRLRVQAVPGDARIFVDDRLAGIGAYDGSVTLGKHRVEIERTGRVPSAQEVEVLADVPTSITVELAPPKKPGRTTLIVASSAVGGLLGLSGAGSVGGSPLAALVGLASGAGVGALGGYFLVPDDVTLGQSSYIITTTLAGFADGALIGALLSGQPGQIAGSDQTRNIGGGGVGGAVIAATVAVVTASRFDPSPGDAAIYNSGAVWGGVAGSLFTAVFKGSSRVQTAIGLTGLNLGLLTGALIAKRYDLSRKRAVYIDLSGIAGITVGAALSAAIDNARGTQSSGESTAHFALGGLAAGLGVGVFLTRNMDVPKLPRLQPSLTTAHDAAGKPTMMVSLTGDL